MRKALSAMHCSKVSRSVKTDNMFNISVSLARHSTAIAPWPTAYIHCSADSICSQKTTSGNEKIILFAHSHSVTAKLFIRSIFKVAVWWSGQHLYSLDQWSCFIMSATVITADTRTFWYQPPRSIQLFMPQAGWSYDTGRSPVSGGRYRLCDPRGRWCFTSFSLLGSDEKLHV